MQGVKSGNISIINKGVPGSSSQRAHLEVVKDDLNLLARFYSDSEKTLRYGVLCMNNCKTSLSSSDLTTIEISAKQNEEDLCKTGHLCKPGLLLKAGTKKEAVQWNEALSSTTQTTLEKEKHDDSLVHVLP